MKVGIPKGMRDFSPQVMAKRNYIFDTIKKSFQLYGFEQIETPTMENRETLTGKYGDEGDSLIFNILQRGDKFKKAITGLELGVRSSQEFNDDAFLNKSVSSFADMALRYDLTVPFARYVVRHQNEISFPFKRFQIQPVWRADRPQKGRYREFYQCDADIIGSDSLLNEVELVKLFDGVLSDLGFKDFSIKLNNRKILSGIAEVIGRPEMIIPITVAIDKLEKIGLEKVKEELSQRGISEEELNLIQPLFEIKGDNVQKLTQLSEFLKDSDIGLKGIEEVQFILSTIDALGLKKATLEVDVTLARGLDYYTGAIFEVVTNEAKMGSICGGGRYADLTGIFGLKNMSGVGISFGADRIYDVMEELGLFPESSSAGTKVFFVNFGEKEAAFALSLLQQLREAGIRVELYPDTAKMKKQMKYANDKQIPFVVMIGDEEMSSGELSLKNMESGEQSKVTVEELIKAVRK
ncbi:MAG: histidine--tRNA ligase [Flavobacteriales bacterium]|nr:histidine--tRNA ligase [Flavobacteriales bacterium]